MKEGNNFNGIAKYYDLLARLVFGKTLIQAQTFFLKEIPVNATILLAGDGSGTCLSYLLQHSSCSKIVSIDPSESMTALAQKRIASLSYTTEIQFVKNKIEAVCLSETFDVIITPFLLDMFTGEKTAQVINLLLLQLKPGGAWIFTDFRIEKNSINRYWQRLLLFVMYQFFRRMCQIEASELPSFEKYFSSAGMIPEESKDYYGKMIRSTKYRKGNLKTVG